MGRKKKRESKVLTETELKLMTIIWHLGQATVHEVMEQLPADQYAYNTVSTLIRLLEQKEFLTSEKVGRGHSYRPIVSKAKYEEIGVGQLVDGLFEGKPVALIKSLLGQADLNSEELKALKKLLADKE